jgi:hypothetical protein
MQLVQQPYGDEVPNVTMRGILSIAGLAAVIPFIVVMVATRSGSGLTANQIDLVVVPVALFMIAFPALIAILTPRRGTEMHRPHRDHPISAPKWPYIMVAAVALLALTFAVLIYGGFAFLVNT